MKIAVVGAGLCGLSLAWKLLEHGSEVTLFDSKGVGGGASGVASGLMHPYAGEQCKRRWHADEGLKASLALLHQVEAYLGAPVARYDGIVRFVETQDQFETFLSHAVEYGDVELQDDRSFLIKSGVTVNCGEYLEGLWQMIHAKGGLFEKRQIHSLEELCHFDSIVLAAGAGIALFPESKSLRFGLTRGQVLTAHAQENLVEKSMVGKGYIALGEKPGIYYFGSTYERSSSEEPCLEVASQLILPQIATLFPEIGAFSIVDCRAGVRVSRRGNYHPIARLLTEKCWAITAMASRGLLYHAHVADLVKAAILGQGESILPKELL